MEANLYVKLEILKETSGYIHIEDAIIDEHIEDDYRRSLEISRGFGHGKSESFQGHKLKYIYVPVTYDGRKRSISNNDVLQSLEREGLAYKVASGGMFSDYYKPTDKLNDMLEEQLKQRKELINNGEYKVIA